MNEWQLSKWQTEDFIFPKFADTRGSKVEKLPGGDVWNYEELVVLNRRRGDEPIQHVNLTQTYEVSFECNFDVDFTIEDHYMKMIGQEMAKAVDEEIMKVLMGDTTPTKAFSPDYGTAIASLSLILGNPEKQDHKYSDYERAMSIVKGN